jgi:hypothetical protein
LDGLKTRRAVWAGDELAQRIESLLELVAGVAVEIFGVEGFPQDKLSITYFINSKVMAEGVKRFTKTAGRQDGEHVGKRSTHGPACCRDRTSGHKLLLLGLGGMNEILQLVLVRS